MSISENICLIDCEKWLNVATSHRAGTPVDLVEQLVKPAEGLFILASTVVGFIKDDGGLDYLLRAIVDCQVKGLDGLYREVLATP